MRKFIFMMTMLMMTLSVSAQHVKEGKFFDNTYVTVGAGLTNPTTDWNWSYDFEDELHSNFRPMFQVEIGKALTTYYTTALEFDTRVNTTKSKTVFDEMAVQWLHKVNLLNVIEGYRERKFELYPMFGVGWSKNLANKDDYGVFSTAVEMDWNVNEKWAIMLKPQLRWRHAENGLNIQRSDVGVSVGVIYRINDRFQTCDYDVVVADNQKLNEEVNKLRGALAHNTKMLAEQGKVIKALQHQKSEVREVIIDNTVTPTIGFMKNRYKVTPDKMAYLHMLAKKYKGRKLMVVGYADKGTGTHKYNKELSEKRANAIKEALVKMGLNEQDIETKAMGDSEQPFEDNDMNRVVIIEK